MFFHGNPVPPDLFVGRRREVREIASRIASYGQSTAVIGQPRAGKTSLLAYLASTAGRKEAQRRTPTRLLYSYIDAYTLTAGLDHADFWGRLFDPLSKVKAEDVSCPEEILASHQVCRAAGFERAAVERLLRCLNAADIRLVALIDEVDQLVQHPPAEPARFFGTLRSLTTLSQGALALVLASRSPVKGLNKVVDGYGFSGSPCFNFVEEVFLGPLSEEDVDALLERGSGRFSEEDCRHLREVSGGHPYLLQAAAAALWFAHEDEHPDPRSRRDAAARASYREASRTLSNIWTHWTPALKAAFTAVAVGHIDAISGAVGLQRKGSPGRRELSLNMSAFEAELELLNEQGFIREDSTTSSGWRVRPLSFLAWSAAELRKAAASEKRWEQWLHEHVWEGRPSADERRLWTEIIRPGLSTSTIQIDLFSTTRRQPVTRPRRPIQSDIPPPPSSAPAGTLPPQRSPVRLYLSYAPEDEPLIEDLEKHLAALKKEGLLETWSRRSVSAGEDWHSSASELLGAADVALLCVSSSFVDSDYCYGVEVKLAMERRRLGEIEVVPVVLHPADWRRLPFGELQPLPREGKPVSTWRNRHQAWHDVAQGVRSAVKRIVEGERQAQEGPRSRT